MKYLVTTMQPPASGYRSLAELAERLAEWPADQSCTLWQLPDADLGTADRIFTGTARQAAAFAARLAQ